jgi:hypothetical protein
MTDPSALLPPGLCSHCRHAERVRSKRSDFVRCRLADADPRFDRYPRLPVVDCAGFVDASDADRSGLVR